MRFLACGVLVALAACTSPNPKSCLDGSCTDPRYPFCDENGVIADEPKTCVAPACSAGEVLECRGDVAVTCNADGNNYDLVQCDNGCDASGCKTPPPAPVCTTNQDCVTATEPICDTATDTCHACVTHDDCDSEICNRDGSCEPTSNVLFASPTGDSGGDCTKATPCTLTRAITQVINSPTKVVRMLPGHYTQLLSFKQPTGIMVRVVAAGAILDATSRLEVANGAKVRVEEVDSRAVTTNPGVSPVSCLGPPSSSLTLERSHILTTDSVGTTHFYQCVVTFDQVDFETQVSPLMNLGSDTTFIADRMHVHGGANFWTMAGTNQRFQMTNSLIEGATASPSSSDTGTSVSTFLFAFNTFVFNGMGQFGCPETIDSGNKIVRVENNIIVGLGTQSTVVVNPETCGPYMTNTMNKFDHNVVFPFTGASGTNIVMDPKFMNAATQDFRLQATSPARDAAIPSGDLTTNHDYDGAPRTGSLDIGAYELQ